MGGVEKILPLGSIANFALNMAKQE
jgi:hypothetical protein